MKRGLWVYDLVGSLTQGVRPLEGKSFYLDEVKTRQSAVITEIIGRLGGKLESFLHKDVSVVVTGNRQALTDGPLERSPATLGKIKAEAASSPSLRRDSVNNAQRPGTPRPPVCGSRGKALLEKVIRNNEKSHCGVLTNARSWGVKIVGVDDFMKIIDQLTEELSTHKNKRIENNKTKLHTLTICMVITDPLALSLQQKKAAECSGLRIAKAGALKSDFLKVEDSSRKYRPLHAQSLSFSMMSYTGKFSPFEPPAPLQPGKRKGGEDKLRKSDVSFSSFDKPSAPLPQTNSPRQPRKKSLGYCECCQVSYKNQDEHLQSDLHRHFVEDTTNYVVVDQLVAGMSAVFSSCLAQELDSSLIRVSDCSPGPLSPLAEMVEQTKSETESALQAILNQSSDQLLANMSTVTADPKQDFEPVCDAPTQLQEPDSVVLPQTSFISKTVCEKVNIHVVLEPDTHVFNQHSEDIPGVIINSELLPQIPCTAEDLAKLDCDCPSAFPSPEPSQQPKLDKNKSSSDSSNFSKQQLCEHYVGKSDEQGSTLMVVEHMALNLSERDKNSEKQALVYVSSSSAHCSVNLSVNINPRKRCRSFTLSPKASKKRRSNHWPGQRSDPTNKRSTVSLTYLTSLGSGLLQTSDKREDNSKTNCTKDNTSVNDELETCKPDLLHSDAQRSNLALTGIPEDRPSFPKDQHSICRAQGAPATEQYPNRTPELEPHVLAVGGAIGDKSSELGPPQLYPFYHDVHKQEFSLLDPPKLIPAIAFPSPTEKLARPPAGQASSASLLSQSFSSVCIESALIPDCAFSPTSSESDWDSGLLSRLAPAVQLPPRGGHCEVDLGLLLQRSCAGVQDGSYASQLYSVLQPPISTPAGFEDPVCSLQAY